MENKLPVRQSRSLVRRVAVPLCLTMILLAGGGWGVYHFTTHPAIGTATPPSERAHSASRDNEELKNLFAEQTPAVVEPAAVKKPQDTKAPETETITLTSETASVVGSRYSSAIPTPTPEAVAPAPVEEVVETIADQPMPEFAVEDIARGQEPQVNPLRAAPEGLERADELDARTAFGEAKTQAVDSEPPVVANPFAKRAGEASAGLRNASPLPQQQNPAGRANGRYGAADTGAVAEGPAPAFGIEPPQSMRQKPMQQEPMRQELSAAPTAPLGAQLGAASESITPTPGLTSRTGTGRPGEQLLEGAQSPSITIQKLAPEEIQVGKRCTFAIRIQNTGQRTAQNVQIHDEVPLGTELVGTAPRAAVSGAHVVWELGTLSVGEERTVEMELIPTEEGELGSVATVTLAAQASAKARCTRPELALRLSCKPQVLEGQQHVVQIEISNPGSGDATDVMLLSNLPQSVSHEAGPALEYEIGTLRPGETRQMELILTAEQAGRVNNVMTARADANLRVEANCEFEIIAPELQLTIEGPQRRYLERPATYRINVDNPGTATAQEIQLVTRLPKGLQFVSANNLGEYDSSSHSVRWSLAELPANEQGTVELVALPVEAGEQVLQATTNAGPSLEDRTEKTVLIEGLAALTFEVTDLQGLIEVGGETTYEIVVANKGSKAADNVQVVAIMPPGMRALSGQGETRHTIQGERVIFSPLPQLAPKAETIFRIQAQGIRPGDQRVRVQIETDELQQPITKEVNTRVYADE